MTQSNIVSAPMPARRAPMAAPIAPPTMTPGMPSPPSQIFGMPPRSSEKRLQSVTTW